MKGCVCARHCDRSGNGIHTWLLRSMMSPALEKRLGVDRMWPLYLTAGQKRTSAYIRAVIRSYLR
ncbi:hypothetical protein, partial [Syntrophorhabdus aromaticivorans]|uniref:hypothetical protein n=1 Tax=Syntrophorhabdus aromaticivorans TaxID=328301 RepID=UPI001A9A411D